MTNVRRPIHLQLRPASGIGGGGGSAGIGALIAPTTTTCSSKALSPTSGDSLPSQILPHLFVGNQEQTNRETLNRLNISYILSLGLMPLISNSVSPTSPTNSSSSTTHNQQQQRHPYHTLALPSQNSSKDFKIRVRSSGVVATSVGNQSTTMASINVVEASNISGSNRTNHHQLSKQQLDRDGGENKGVKLVRSIQCKCINIADNSEQILTKFFDEAHQFIEEARRKKCNILVHCLAGISRSPTIAIAYLMRVNSLRLQDAYNLVKQCRPQIDPNLSFMGQLMIYEKSLEAANKISQQQQTAATTTTASINNHHHSSHNNIISNNGSKLSSPSSTATTTSSSNILDSSTKLSC